MSVASHMNAGTTFSLYFPACASGADSIKLGTVPLQHGRGGILVIDDEEPIRLLAKEMLSHCGYQCVLAKDGHETITLFQQALKNVTTFSAVILDLTIQGRLGGKDAILRLREIDPQVVAFVSSSYSNDPIITNFHTYGFQGVMTKPYSLIGLSTILHQRLNIMPSPADSYPDTETSETSDCHTH